MSSGGTKNVLFLGFINCAMMLTQGSFLSDQRSSWFPKFVKLTDLHLDDIHVNAFSINISLYQDPSHQHSQSIGFAEMMVEICSRRQKSSLTVLGSSPPLLICLSTAQLAARSGPHLYTEQDVIPVYCGEGRDGPCGGRHLHTRQRLVVVYTNQVHNWKSSFLACADGEWIVKNQFLDLRHKKTVYSCLEDCPYFVLWDWWSDLRNKQISQVCYCLHPNTTVRIWDLKNHCSYWSVNSQFPGPTSIIRYPPGSNWLNSIKDDSVAIYCKKSRCSNAIFSENKPHNFSSAIDRFFAQDSKCIGHESEDNSWTPFLNSSAFSTPSWNWDKRADQKCASHNSSLVYLISGRKCQYGPATALKPSLQLYQDCLHCSCWDQHSEDICKNQTHNIVQHRLHDFCGLTNLYYSAYNITPFYKNIKFLQCVSSNITNKFRFYSEKTLMKNVSVVSQAQCLQNCSSFAFTLMADLEDGFKCYCLPKYFRFSLRDLSESCISSWSTITGLPISQNEGSYAVYYNASFCGHNCPTFINSFLQMDQSHFCDTFKVKSSIIFSDPNKQTGATYRCYKHKINRMWSLREQQFGLKTTKTTMSVVSMSTEVSSLSTFTTESMSALESQDSSTEISTISSTLMSSTTVSSSSTVGSSTEMPTMSPMLVYSSAPLSSSTVDSFECFAVDARGEIWISTGGEVLQKCPNGTTGTATWYCDCGSFVGEQPDRTNCKEDWINHIKNMIDNETSGSLNISRRLTQMMNENLTAGGLIQLQSVFIQLINLHQNEVESIISINRTEFTSNLISSLNEAVHQELAWSEISNTSQRLSIIKAILTQIESISYTRLEYENQTVVIFLNRTNLSVNITNKVTVGAALGFKSDGAQITVHSGWTIDNFNTNDDAFQKNIQPNNDTFEKNIEINGVTFKKNMDTNGDAFEKNIKNNGDAIEKKIDMVAFAVTLPHTSLNFPKQSHPNSINNGSLFNTIIGISMARKNIIRMTDNVVKITFYQPRNKSTLNTCVFWSPEKKSWLTEGCYEDPEFSHGDVSVCLCDHLTNFGIIFDVGGFVDAGDKMLNTITTILGSISCICIFITLLSLCRVSKLEHIRHVVEFHRNICLLSGMILFLGLVDLPAKVHVPHSLCQSIGILTHYTWLAFFAWTGLEGFALYKALVTVFDNGSSNRMVYFLVGYGIPGVLVIATILGCLLFGTDFLYSRPGTCWIHSDYIWTFVVPVYGVIVFNIVVLFIGLTVAYKAASDMKTMSIREKVRSCCRNCILLTCLLGITWAMGFYYKPAPAQVTFVILNSSCGIFIFSYSVLFNPKVRQELRRIYTRGGSGGPSWTCKSSKTNSQAFTMAGRRNTVTNI